MNASPTNATKLLALARLTHAFRPRLSSTPGAGGTAPASRAIARAAISCISESNSGRRPAMRTVSPRARSS